MSTFNVTLSALLFAAAVSASAATFPSQAEAGRKWNGITVNGIILNGMRVQGIDFNGMRVQGVKLRGAGEPSQPAGVFDANAVTIKMITFPEAK